MFEKKSIRDLTYKEQYKIYKVSYIYKHFMRRFDDLNYPNILISTTSLSQEPVQSYLDEGWMDSGYDWYNAEYHYHKTVDIRDNITDLEVVFIKKTDERDKEVFGFKAKTLFGGYHYPIPEVLREDICKFIYDNGCKTWPDFKGFPDDLDQKIIDEVAQNIIEDEFIALKEYKISLRNAFNNSIDKALSEKEQLHAFVEAARKIKNPADINLSGSRSITVYRDVLNDVCEHAGITL